jgi:UTP--glucose-1-phosphate uridylyltransferase
MGMSASVRKAVFPAAGLGTRFLPATKAIPKEMLPLVDKPTIQYGVEEAMSSGLTNIILVTSRGKSAMEDHFDESSDLVNFLESKGKKALADEVRKVMSLTNVTSIRQGEPLGLGHAVLVTEDVVGDEPFAVILADDVYDADPPALKQMIDVFDRAQGPVIAVERVPMEKVSSYGVIAGTPAPEFGKDVYRITDLVEKPPRDQAPSDLAIVGRYILTPDIFASLHATNKDKSGEIQLTNGMRHLLKSRPLYAVVIDGVRHDTGNNLGFLKANVYFGLKRPEIADAFRDYLKTLK